MFLSGPFSPTFDPWGGSTTRPGAAVVGACAEAVCSDVGHGWKAPVAHETQA